MRKIIQSAWAEVAYEPSASVRLPVPATPGSTITVKSSRVLSELTDSLGNRYTRTVPSSEGVLWQGYTYITLAGSLTVTATTQHVAPDLRVEVEEWR